MDCAGEIFLVDACIGGSFHLNDAQLLKPGGVALRAGGLTVAGDLQCCGDFRTDGEVNMFGATIERRFDLRGARLRNPGGHALDLERLTAGALYLLPRDRPVGTIDLTNAHVGDYYDEPETWATDIRLRGFTYDDLQNQSISVRSRLDWLTHNGEQYVPGLYDQLAAAYRRACCAPLRMPTKWRCAVVEGAD